MPEETFGWFYYKTAVEFSFATLLARDAGEQSI